MADIRKRYAVLAPAPWWQYPADPNRNLWGIVDTDKPLGLETARIVAYVIGEEGARELAGRLNWLELLLSMPRPGASWEFRGYAGETDRPGIQSREDGERGIRASDPTYPLGPEGGD